jgi:hypothetical protein
MKREEIKLLLSQEGCWTFHFNRIVAAIVMVEMHLWRDYNT